MPTPECVKLLLRDAMREKTDDAVPENEMERKRAEILASTLEPDPPYVKLLVLFDIRDKAAVATPEKENALKNALILFSAREPVPVNVRSLVYPIPPTSAPIGLNQPGHKDLRPATRLGIKSATKANPAVAE